MHITFPEVTVGDQVRVEARLADALGIDRWACVVGGSMGGMRALEWAVAYPDRVASLFFLASGAEASADQIGTQTTQQAAIRADPDLTAKERAALIEVYEAFVARKH